MRRLLAIAVLLLGLTMAAGAQVDIEAVGGRLGVGNGFEIEGSAQLSFGRHNRIEADLGMASVITPDHSWVYMNLTGIYQWKWKLDKQIDWYAGAGGTMGFYSGSRNDYMGIGIGAVGQVGIEYNFPDLPLQVSADLRPRLALVGRFGVDATVGVSARYLF